MEQKLNIGNADNISNAHPTTVKATTKKETKMPDKPKRKYNTPPLTGVLKQAKRQFMRQVIKNNDTKRGCIEANISDHYDDGLRFWLDFNKKVKMLLDSVRFNEYCKSKNHVALQVAEHTVFEGNDFYNAVIQGNYEDLDEKAHMFNGNLT